MGLFVYNAPCLADLDYAKNLRTLHIDPCFSSEELICRRAYYTYL